MKLIVYMAGTTHHEVSELSGLTNSRTYKIAFSQQSPTIMAAKKHASLHFKSFCLSNIKAVHS